MKTVLIIIGNIIALLILIGAANAQESSGYIYGTVTTYSTSYTGQIRWADEEAYWNDYFNAYKMGDEYLESILSEKGDNKEISGSRNNATDQSLKIKIECYDCKVKLKG